MKPLYLSKTVWGAIAAALGVLLHQIQTKPPQTAAEWVTLLLAVVGAVVGAIGVRDAVRQTERAARGE